MKRFSNLRQKRHLRIRKKIQGTAARPRLCVFRSTKHIYVQAIDDISGITVASACSLLKDLPVVEGEITGKRRVAKAVGKMLAQKLKEKGVVEVIFDRGGFLYHGRVAALADGAREGGLKF